MITVWSYVGKWCRRRNYKMNAEDMNELAGLQEGLEYCNKVAELYYLHPEFLKNQAKVRGLYLKHLRKNGFSKKTAEKIVVNHFDVTVPDEEEVFSAN